MWYKRCFVVEICYGKKVVVKKIVAIAKTVVLMVKKKVLLKSVCGKKKSGWCGKKKSGSWGKALF